jgi:hypothetical protein
MIHGRYNITPGSHDDFERYLNVGERKRRNNQP